MITTGQAVMSLRPGAEWTMSGEDIENIIWHTPNVEPITTEEVQSEIARLEQEQIEKAQAEQKAREDAINHAKSLGFTDEMIAVMYPNLLN
jgi:hypothetical protein